MHEFEPSDTSVSDEDSTMFGVDNTPTHVSTFANADGGSITLVEWGLNEPFTTDSTDVFMIVHDDAQRHEGA